MELIKEFLLITLTVSSGAAWFWLLDLAINQAKRCDVDREWVYKLCVVAWFVLTISLLITAASHK